VTRDEARRVLLVGFMGSGKTSVGRLVAEALGWRFIDVDDVIEAEAGKTVREIFEQDGEGRFRSLEAAVSGKLLSAERVVLGSGGGWAALPDRWETVPEGTVSFWLKVSPTEAVRRVGTQPGSRPLLDRPDALEVASELLSERAPFYARARWTVDTESRSVEDVSAAVQEILSRGHP